MCCLLLLFVLLGGLSCAKDQPPTAPAGKSTGDDLADLFDLFDVLPESEEDTAADSTASAAPDSSSASDSSSVSSSSDSSPSAVVFIPDRRLREQVEQALGKRPGETITQADMSTLRSLLRGTESLKGLETAKNLKHLSVTGAPDLSPLAHLTKLENLFLSTSATDLSVLKNLAELRHLYLGSFRKGSDLSPLAHLTKLERLEIRGNATRGDNAGLLSPAESYQTKIQLQVDILAFGWTFDPIPRLVQVTVSPVSDLSPLANLTNLKRLDILFSQVSDLSPLANLTNLERIDISYSQVSDLSPLANLTNLKRLGIAYNQVSDLTPVENLTNLERLDFSINKVSDLIPVRNLTQLKELYFTANQVSNITLVRNLTQLERLYFSINKVSGLTPVRNLTQLKKLYFSINQISDLTPVRALPNLEELRAEDNPLSTTSLNEHIPALQSRGVDVSFSPGYIAPNTDILSPEDVSPDVESPFRIELVFLDDFTEAEQEIWHRIANRWELAIQTELPDTESSVEWYVRCGDHSITIPAGEQIDDLRVYITKFDLTDKVPQLLRPGLLGYAAPLILRPSAMPIVGCIGIHKDLSTLFDDLWDIGRHEMGHVLGIGTLWDEGGMLRGLNADTHFAGPQAIAAFDQAGGREYRGAKVPTELDGGHWRAGVLAHELMALDFWRGGAHGLLELRTGDALSAITLGALSDLGYTVDFSAADPYELPPLGAAKPVADAVPFCSLEILPPPVYMDD